MKTTTRHMLYFIGLLCCVLMATHIVLAEDDTSGLKLGNWTITGVFTGAGSISRYNDWQGGGSDATSGNLLTEIDAVYAKDKSTWKNTLKVEYGVSKLSGGDSQKSADKLLLESQYDYSFHPHFSFYARAGFDTNMTKGYDYFSEDTDTLYLDTGKTYSGKKMRISDAFDPINLSQGLGINYTILKIEDKHLLQVRLGIGAREMVSSFFYVVEDDEDTDIIEYSHVDDYTDYGFDGGAECKVTLPSNALLTSSAVAFYGLDKEFWKVEWDTTLAVSITKYFGVSITESLLYDEQVFDDLQMKTETLLTLNFRLF